MRIYNDLGKTYQLMSDNCPGDYPSLHDFSETMLKLRKDIESRLSDFPVNTRCLIPFLLPQMTVEHEEEFVVEMMAGYLCQSINQVNLNLGLQSHISLESPVNSTAGKSRL